MNPFEGEKESQTALPCSLWRVFEYPRMNLNALPNQEVFKNLVQDGIQFEIIHSQRLQSEQKTELIFIPSSESLSFDFGLYSKGNPIFHLLIIKDWSSFQDLYGYLRSLRMEQGVREIYFYLNQEVSKKLTPDLFRKVQDYAQRLVDLKVEKFHTRVVSNSKNLLHLNESGVKVWL